MIKTEMNPVLRLNFRDKTVTTVGKSLTLGYAFSSRQPVSLLGNSVSIATLHCGAFEELFYCVNVSNLLKKIAYLHCSVLRICTVLTC